MSKKVREQPDVVKRISDLERINKEQKQKIEKLETDLNEASDIISGIHEERDASDEEERQQLIWQINRDSRGYQRKEHLQKLSLRDLRLIHKTFKIENARDYLEHFEKRRKEEVAGKRKSGMTVGEYDPKTGTWKK